MGFLLPYAVFPPIPGAFWPPRSPVVRISPAVAEHSKAFISLAALGGWWRMEKLRSNETITVLLARGFRRRRTLPKSRSVVWS